MGGVISADLEIGGHHSLLPAQYTIRDRILVQVSCLKFRISNQEDFRVMLPQQVQVSGDEPSFADFFQADMQVYKCPGALSTYPCRFCSTFRQLLCRIWKLDPSFLV